jgi:hypothetical protein
MIKINKGAVAKLLSNAKENNIERVVIGSVDGEDIMIEVKKNIDIDTYYRLCGIFSTPSFSITANGESEYVPSGSRSVFISAITKAFTDFPLNDDVNKAYDVICKLGLYEKIYPILQNSTQFKELERIEERYSLYNLMCKTGINGLFATLKNMFSGINFAEFLKPDNPELIEHFTNLFSQLQPSAADEVNAGTN